MTPSSIDAPAPVVSEQQEGFAPGSVYAEWTDRQREQADRVERDFNAHRSSILALADEKSGHSVRSLADEQLPRTARRIARQIEDIEAGDRLGSKAQVWMLRAQLHDVEREQQFRAALAYSWLAVEHGTHSLTAFEARGGLAAVLENGASAPSYDLAVLLDRQQFLRGLPCVLDWAATERQEVVA